MSAIFGLVDTISKLATKEDLANATTNDKGIFSTDAILKAKYPAATNRKDFYAFVGTQNPFRKWEVQADGGQWVDTGEDMDIADINFAEYTPNGGYKGTAQDIANIANNLETKIEEHTANAFAHVQAIEEPGFAVCDMYGNCGLRIDES
jgi:hypothetical protein